MSEPVGRTVRLFLVDGSPTGVTTAEIMNWSGHVLIAPRSRIGEALKRGETDRTGVYCLIGDDPNEPNKSLVSVGEADCIADRIRSHARDESKEFWTRACFITSKDTNLTKSHARYLESRLIELAKSADRANLANSNEPSVKSLPESDTSDMEYFLTQVQVVLPVVGLDFLRQISTRTLADEVHQISSETGTVSLYLRSDLHGIEAQALEVDGELTVLKGSGATVKDDFVSNNYSALRQQLIDDGRIRHSADSDRYEFVEVVIFRSPSAAAAVIFNRNTNGRTAWKVSGSDATLKDWQDAQVIPESE